MNLKWLRGRAVHGPDYFLLASFVLLTALGLVMLSSASFDLGKIKFGDTYHYLRHQIYFGLSLGLVGFYLGSVISYRRYEQLSFFLLLAGIALLILVFTPLGFSAGGATRWVRVGSLTIQPSEIIKLTYLLYCAAFFSKNPAGRAKSFTGGFLPFTAISGIIALLLVMQPATSIAGVIVLAGLIVYLASGASLRYVGLFALIGILGFALLIAVTPYRLERVMTFLEGGDAQGSRYHLEQALITIGSGGLFGVGYGQSTSKYNYLPEPIGDSIFAVIAEELGFAGASILIAIFLLIVARSFLLAWKMTEPFGQLLLVGFSAVIGIQAFVHIASVSGLIPLTGVSLPFISYGSTSLVVFLTMAGIIVNITKSVQR